jgi:hypothetical protein
MVVGEIGWIGLNTQGAISVEVRSDSRMIRARVMILLLMSQVQFL